MNQRQTDQLNYMRSRMGQANAAGHELICADPGCRCTVKPKSIEECEEFFAKHEGHVTYAFDYIREIGPKEDSKGQ